jgi:hypothetical protein
LKGKSRRQKAKKVMLFAFSFLLSAIFAIPYKKSQDGNIGIGA